MRYSKKVLAAILCAIAGLAACQPAVADHASTSANTSLTDTSQQEDGASAQEETTGEATIHTEEIIEVKKEWIEYKKKDYYTDWSAENPVMITLEDGNSQAEGSNVSISGDCITILAAGTYVISGSLSDGQIIVDAGAEADVRLVLNGVTIHAEQSAAIYVKSADKAIISLEAESENVLSDGETHVMDGEEELTAVIYSKEDLTINGDGKLTIVANDNDGITSKDTLKVTSGTISIQAADDGIVGKDAVAILEVDLTIVSAGDAIKSTKTADPMRGFVLLEGGTYNLQAGNDGIQAETGILITSGTFEIVTGGGSANASKTPGQDDWFGGGRTTSESQTADAEETSSAKGIKAKTWISIAGGVFAIDSADDTIHSDCNMTIYDGSLQLSSGDDGMHADETLTIWDGDIQILTSYEGLEGLSIQINGGRTQLVASDDGLNAAGGTDGSSMGWGQGQFAAVEGAEIIINDGYLAVTAGGDGIDSNGDLTINGGEIYVYGPTDGGNGYLDYNGNCAIHGGTIVAMGSAGMLEHPGSESTQVSLTVVLNNQAQAESLVELQDADGNTLYTTTAKKSYQAVLFSGEELKEGETYQLVIDGEMISKHTLSAVTTVVDVDGNAYQGGGFGGSRPGGNKGGMAPPEDMERPEGMEPPRDMELPEGMTMPEGAVTPPADEKQGTIL